ncbi:MAG: hypothetical protein ACI9MC_001290 [Kiritimatiellia bacterium]|jgi:hypothetical protein
MTLVEVLKDDVKRRQVAKDGAVIVNEEVSAKRGLRAAALKAGFKTIKKIKPSIIEDSLFMLLPHFAPEIDPWWDNAVASGDTREFFRTNSGKIADSLLGVTDRRAQRAKNRVMIRVYKGLRGQALKYTTESVHRLPDLVEKYV